MRKKTESIQNLNAILVTEENDDIDVLDRKEFIDRIKQIIEYYADKKQSVSFAIQGTWGCGKSWIINKVYNELYDIQDFDNGGSKYCIFTYNAWDYDYYDEPLISLVISLYKQLNNENAILIKNEKTRENVNMFFRGIKDTFLEDLKHITFIGNIINFKQDYHKIIEKYNDKKRKYDYHFDINKIMEATIKGLNKLSINKTVVLFIDELDRCLPAYAIKVLERIHHIKQYVKNIEIIYAIDKDQLKQTIENCFGINEHETIKNYLSKFIDFGLTVSPSTFNAEISKKYDELFQQFDFIRCDRDNDVTGLVQKLLPETIPIRTHQLILKKIIFINNQLNTHTKLDYSLLISELFVALADELNMDWEFISLGYNPEMQTPVLISQNIKPPYKAPLEIENFIFIINCPEYYSLSQSSMNEGKIWLDLWEQDNNISALSLYYIARLMNSKNFYPGNIVKYVKENDDYLKRFKDYYKTLNM